MFTADVNGMLTLLVSSCHDTATTHTAQCISPCPESPCSYILHPLCEQRSALLTFHRPFSLGSRRLTGYFSTILLVVTMVVLQVFLLDLVVVPLINEAVEKTEANGSQLDWLREYFFNGTTV